MTERDYSMEERAQLIKGACLEQQSKDPIHIFREIAKMDFIRIHGPEHHVLNGSAVLTAFHNAGGKIELSEALDELIKRALQMPGASCGFWAVCGAVSSVGAALSIIESTGPLTDNDSWGSHMIYSSNALRRLADIGGPRCCKRDGFLALQESVLYINERFGLSLESEKISCEFSGLNMQCIKGRCPFHS